MPEVQEFVIESHSCDPDGHLLAVARGLLKAAIVREWQKDAQIEKQATVIKELTGQLAAANAGIVDERKLSRETEANFRRALAERDALREQVEALQSQLAIAKGLTPTPAPKHSE